MIARYSSVTARSTSTLEARRVGARAAGAADQ
jgi:hypothetical protein